jgi:hypothetical protein
MVWSWSQPPPFFFETLTPEKPAASVPFPLIDSSRHGNIIIFHGKKILCGYVSVLATTGCMLRGGLGFTNAVWPNSAMMTWFLPTIKGQEA